MSLAAQKRTKVVRDTRYREKIAQDGWRWLRKAILMWLWQERNGERRQSHLRDRYLAHRDHEKAEARRRYVDNRAHRLITMAAYRERHRANINAANREDYAAKKGIVP